MFGAVSSPRGTYVIMGAWSRAVFHIMWKRVLYVFVCLRCEQRARMRLVLSHVRAVSHGRVFGVLPAAMAETGLCISSYNSLLSWAL